MSKTALVTGPTAGIGRSFAHQLAREGYDLVLVARDRARLEAEATELSATYDVAVEVLPADLVDREQLATVEARLGDPDRPIDLLVNNGGFGLKKNFLDNPVDSEQAMLDVLVVAVMRLSHAALSAMCARGSGGIINVSSVSAFLPRGSYGAAKSWVNSFSEWAHYEYRDQGVTVTCLCPGFTKTEFHERMSVDRGSAPDFMWLDADELVATALKDHAKGRVFSIPGPQYKAIVTAGRLVPTSLLQRFQGLGRK
jgi:uncharacterized protein